MVGALCVLVILASMPFATQTFCASGRTSPDLLSGVVEVDESYIGGVSPGTRGRGPTRRSSRSRSSGSAGGKKSKRVKLGRVRMRVIPNTQRRTLEEFITDVVAPGSVVHTDGKREYDRVDMLDSYLDEFSFRFNRRASRNRGLVFYRLLQQCLHTRPLGYEDIVFSRRPERGKVRGLTPTPRTRAAKP
jgi:transposase-like protein